MLLILFIVVTYILYRLSFFRIMHPNLMTYYFMTGYIFIGGIISEFTLQYLEIIPLIVLSMLSILVAHIIIYYLLNYKKFLHMVKYAKINTLSNAYRFIYYILLVVHILIILLYFKKYGITIFTENLEIARTEVLHKDKIYFYNLLILNSILLIFSFFLFKSKYYYFFLTISIFVLTCTGFRALPFNVILIHIILLSYKRGLNLIKVNKKIFPYFVIILFLSIIITYFRLSEENRNFIVASQVLFFRVVFNNIDNIYNIVVYHQNHGFLYGRGYLWDLHPIFRYIFFFLNIPRRKTFAEYISSELNPLSEDIFVITPTIIGAAYANWGKIGVFLIILAINIIHFIIAKNMIKKNYLQPLLVYFTYLGAVVVTRDFASVYSLYLFPVLILFILIIIFTSVIRGLK